MVLHMRFISRLRWSLMDSDFFDLTGAKARSLLRKQDCEDSQSPSFPHACSGGSTELTTGETGTGPRSKHSGVTTFGKTLINHF